MSAARHPFHEWIQLELLVQCSVVNTIRHHTGDGIDVVTGVDVRCRAFGYPRRVFIDATETLYEFRCLRRHYDFAGWRSRQCSAMASRVATQASS